MPTDSADHDLTRRDPADAPRCPMERLADRFNDAPKPKWLDRGAFRTAEGECYVAMNAYLTDRDQIDELINFLARVKQ